MNEAPIVVRNTVGRTTSSATPTMKTVKSRATSKAMRSAATREKTKTVIVKVINMRRGRPVRAILDRRKAESFGLLTANA